MKSPADPVSIKTGEATPYALADPGTLLPVGRYRLEFVAEETVHLPGYPGSAWRDALGHALRATVCVTRERECGACLLYRSCVYPYVFETPPPVGAVKMRRYRAAPHPFVLQIENVGSAADDFAEPEAVDATLSPRAVAEGERVVLGLVLFGRANRELPYFVHALGRAAAEGIGGGRGRLALVSVWQQDLATDTWTRIHASGGPLAARAVSSPGPAPAPREPVRVLIATPLRLRRDDR